MKSVYFRADNAFMSAWDRFWTRLDSKYTIKEYGDGSFHVYSMVNLFGVFPMINMRESVHPTFNYALDWCEKQFKDQHVKNVTYVVGYN